MTVQTLPTSAEVISGTQTNAQQKTDFASLFDFVLAQLGKISGQGPQTVASAATLDLDAVTDTRDIVISGTTPITAVTIEAGKVFRCRASGAFTLTNNAAIVTNTGSNIIAASGHSFILRATAANTVEVLNYSRGGAILSTADGGTGNALGGNSEPIAIFRDVKAKNTNGGSSSAGDNTRVLNSTQVNNISGCSLNTGTGVITLPAGTYEVYASAPCYRGDDHQVFLYNNTDAAVAIAGTSDLSLTGQATSTQSFLDGVITIAAQKDFTLRHFILTAIAANGLGVAANSATINAEVYSVIKIKRRFV